MVVLVKREMLSLQFVCESFLELKGWQPVAVSRCMAPAV